MMSREIYPGVSRISPLWIQFPSNNIVSLRSSIDSSLSLPRYSTLVLDEDENRFFRSAPIHASSFLQLLNVACKIYIYMYVKIERERGNRGRRRNGSKGAWRARFAEEWKRKRERCYDTRKKGSWRHSTTISRHSSFYSSRFTTLSFSSLLLPLLPIIALFARDTRSAFYPFDSSSSVARQWTTSDFEIITREIFWLLDFRSFPREEGS